MAAKVERFQARRNRLAVQKPRQNPIWLKVAVANAPARALYARFGFEVYGLEKASLRVDGRDVDQEYRVLMLR